MWNNPYSGPGYGMRDSVGGAGSPGGTQLTREALDQKVIARDDRSRWLWEFGDSFWLPVSLAIGTTPAAGVSFVRSTMAVDFDMLVVGAHADLRLSTVQILDTARQRLLTNATTLISAIATFTTTFTMDRAYWQRPYFLPARSQLQVTVTADGTESNGNFIFLCLQPPNYTA